MSRLVSRGKYLFDGERKFYARGVSYGPFTTNSRGERYPEPERAAADFALMRELGANTIRLYVPPPEWLVEEAVAHELKLMVGFPWPFHMAFLDSPPMMREIRDTIRNGVTAMRKYGNAILAYSLGNEVRSDIVRWHGPDKVSAFLAELYDLGRQADPDGLFTYSNYPSAEYLDLSFLDVISFNVYLHREEDYRRYLTHLLATAGDRPVILSETGMDTMREGEDQQAELLTWQARAAFELGLSGFVVFAFTDEWHTGGAEITEWAFGLTTRERRPKKAFGALAEVLRSELPGPLPTTPKVSVVVAAYNAEPTLGACLESLRELNYPDYEVIVVDDGSSDATARIAEQAGEHAVRVDHRGLGAARNAGVDAATGQIVAFIDADARADRDWLYHLVETITRRNAAAAGGLSFPPPPANVEAAFMAAAPGLPREVRAGDDRLSQLCGCNMAIRKSALLAAGGFDSAFTTAGDDVDLSWRLSERGELLALASGAVVLHTPRAKFGAYLTQQRGYGAGEGLLWRRWPLRSHVPDGMYGGESWWSALLRGVRVYHGAFGRGLFQTVYRTSGLPAGAELPLTIWWVAISFVLFDFGPSSRVLGVIGGCGLLLSLLAAARGTARARLRGEFRTLPARIPLFWLNLLGPLVRSTARERVKWQFAPALPEDRGDSSPEFRLDGLVTFSPGTADGVRPIERARLLDSCRRSLLRRGAAVAVTDGFQSYDLEMIVPPLLRVPINALQRDHGRLALRWKLRIAMQRAAIGAGAAIILLAAAGLGLAGAIGLVVLGLAAIGTFAWTRGRRIPSLIRESALDTAFELGASADEAPES